MKTENLIIVGVFAALIALIIQGGRVEAVSYTPQLGRYAVACSTYGRCVKMDTTSGVVQKFSIE